VPALGEIRIGISGWTYAGWRGTFYPEKLPHNKELSYAAGILRSIEINGTFYSLQRPGTFAKWAAATPDDFVFAVKGSRFITHVQRLKEVRAPLANFFASGVLRLGPKLGPFLWQLPPNFKFDAKRIENFLKILPRDTGAAQTLARRHDKRVSGRAWMKAANHRPLRHAIEIRNQSFAVPEFIDLLRAYGAALVCADTVEWPRLMDLTSDFMYCRLHGSEQLYSSGYDDHALDAWAERAVAWAGGREPNDAERVIDKPGSKLPKRDVYVYFDNDAKVRAPFDAQGLMARVAKLGSKPESKLIAANPRARRTSRAKNGVITTRSYNF
jgi:uncharacterized protein YecE (DUF72 family)